MGIGMISESHSNIEALSEVLRVADQQNLDRVVSLGDIVGYGASPNPCCELVRSTSEVTLLGNHDAAGAGRMDSSFYYEAPRPPLALSSTVLSEQTLPFL